MRGNKVGGENCAKLGKIYICFVWPVQEMHAFNLTACTSVLAYKLCFQVLSSNNVYHCAASKVQAYFSSFVEATSQAY